MTPLGLVLLVAAGVTLACWVLSVVTRETSWVDRAWSIVPAVYVWIFTIDAMLEGREFARLLLMAVLVTAWAARLTFNFARKGGYSGMEDYRWAILRGRMKPWQFQLFNLFFIEIYQNALLVAISLPALMAWANPTRLTGWDIVFAAVFVLLLLGETVADQQQWRFQEAKRRAGGALEPGFVTTGLFRFSRHPNFFCEQGQWWMLYGMGAAAAVANHVAFWGGAVNWTIVGPVLLTVLFIGSTIFTESISAAKYPAYRIYQRSTSMLVPWFPARRAAAPERAGTPG